MNDGMPSQRRIPALHSAVTIDDEAEQAERTQIIGKNNASAFETTNKNSLRKNQTFSSLTACDGKNESENTSPSSLGCANKNNGDVMNAGEDDDVDMTTIPQRTPTASPTAASTVKGPITSLNSYDVLLGRGSGTSLYIGNQKFRMIVDDHKEEYLETSGNKPKAKIAKEILDHIHSLGGRFLKLDENAEPVEFIIEDGEWYETDEKAALEKIKQSLRQKREKEILPDAAKSDGETGASERKEATDDHLSSSAVSLPDVTSVSLSDLSNNVSAVPASEISLSKVPSSFQPISPLQLGGNEGYSVFDSRLLLFQTAPFAFYPSQLGPDVQLSARVNPYGFPADSRLLGSPFITAAQQQGPACHTPHSQACDSNLGKKHSITPTNVQGNNNTRVGQAEANESVETRNKQREDTASDVAQGSQSFAPRDDDITEYILSILALSGRAKFTEQQSELEKATLTDRERAEALSDLFGRTCSLNTHENKRPRRDLDRESIDFLVRQMRAEMDSIPIDKKLAMMEAQAKGRADEFSDERLTKFLRCEGMNAELAAYRFINYWEGRREVFGADKYLQRMTLSEALREDLVALEAACKCLLPGVDASGRPIIFFNPPRHTREGYTSESMVRT